MTARRKRLLDMLCRKQIGKYAEGVNTHKSFGSPHFDDSVSLLEFRWTEAVPLMCETLLSLGGSCPVGAIGPF